MKVKVSKTLAPGIHKGKIKDISERPVNDYVYIDIVIEVEGRELRYSAPDNITLDEQNNPKSKLAKLLKKFGFTLSEGQDITVEDMKIMLGSDVEVETEHKNGKDGNTYSEIISIRPVINGKK
jgi:hypothetical protein